MDTLKSIGIISETVERGCGKVFGVLVSSCGASFDIISGFSNVLVPKRLLIRFFRLSTFASCHTC